MIKDISMRIEDYLYVDEASIKINNQANPWQEDYIPGVSQKHTISFGMKREDTLKEHYKTALEQINKAKVDINTIAKYVQDFLLSNSIRTTLNPVYKTFPVNYKNIKKDFNLNDAKDILWMKFAKDIHNSNVTLGAIKTGNDVDFDIPPNTDEYDIVIAHCSSYENKYKWRWNTSGVLLHMLGLSWDESFILLFPLANIPEPYNRYDIELAVGNYLIAKDVPIIDYYSHKHYPSTYNDIMEKYASKLESIKSPIYNQIK